MREYSIPAARALDRWLFDGPDGFTPGHDLLAPAVFYQAHHLRGERHVIELLRHGIALGVRPMEKLKRSLHRRRVRIILVDQDEAGPGDGPTLRPGLVG